MSFWLSHVPDDRFDAFWAKVRAALAPGRQRLRDRFGLGHDVDRDATTRGPTATAGVATRKLNDGSEYRIVKIFHEPDALARGSPGWASTSAIVHTPRYFIHGAVRPERARAARRSRLSFE